MHKSNDSLIIKIQAACSHAATRVARVARQTGTPIIIWDHDRGEVRAISPDEALEQLSGIPSPQTSTASESICSTGE
jgi:hypothetical protein